MPKFPYPRGVENELAHLFGLDRKGRTSRNLGLSSITKGEGSLDLYETDDGPVTHRYGDLPGGAFGVGITHRGAFWNVSDLIGAGEDRDDGQDGRMDGHASRLGAAENRLDAHAGRLGSAEGRLDSAEGRLDSHASRIGAVEGDAGGLGTRISNAEGRLDNHASRIGATESKNTAQDGRLDSHVSRIGALENRMSALEDQTAARMAQIDVWIRTARNNDPSLPPWSGW